MKVIVFGSGYDNNIAYKISTDIETFEFHYGVDPAEMLEDDHIVIMDTITGIERVTVFTDYHRDEHNHMLAEHDHDLAVFFMLMSEMGIQKQISVVGIPEEGDYETIRFDVERSLQELKDLYGPQPDHP